MLRVAETIHLSDTGRQRRENEDSLYVRAPLFVVADGMGGAQAGEVASQIAVEAFERELSADGPPEQRLAERVREANRRIHEISRSEHERAGMGTTLTAAYLDDSELAIAHVGDSRAYLFRDGALARLTRDHSLVQALLDQGKLTEEQAEEHPQRSIITRALGPEASVEVDTATFPVRGGDVLLLCSDGLTSMISEPKIADVLRGAPTLREAGARLIAAANAAGGRDNITVVLARLEEVGDDALPLGSAGEARNGTDDAPTMVGAPAPGAPAPGAPAAKSARGAVAAPARPGAARLRPSRVERATPETAGRRRRFRRPAAALLALVVVLALILAGGYLATRQLYFIGTNAQGIVTIYRGLPYDLPAGIHLYETFYVSGVPAALVPPSRRAALFNDHLRSQNDAEGVVRSLELGQLSG